MQDQPPYKSNGLKVHKRENPGDLPLVIIISVGSLHTRSRHGLGQSLTENHALYVKSPDIEKGIALRAKETPGLHPRMPWF